MRTVCGGERVGEESSDHDAWKISLWSNSPRLSLHTHCIERRKKERIVILLMKKTLKNKISAFFPHSMRIELKFNARLNFNSVVTISKLNVYTLGYSVHFLVKMVLWPTIFWLEVVFFKSGGHKRRSHWRETSRISAPRSRMQFWLLR